MPDDAWELLMRYYREQLKPEFDKIRSQLDGFMTKAEFDLHMAEIHRRFDRALSQARELNAIVKRIEERLASPDQTSISQFHPRKLD